MIFDEASNQFAHNIRYQLSKKKVEDQFLKWMSEPKTNDLIKGMIQMIKSDNIQKLREMSPSPLFNDKTHYL